MKKKGFYFGLLLSLIGIGSTAVADQVTITNDTPTQ